MNTFHTINPYSEEILNEYSFFPDQKISNILEQTFKAHKDWKLVNWKIRRDTLEKLGKVLLEKEMFLATLITKEMGKPIRQSRAEIQKCAGLCTYYAENGEAFLADQIIHTEAKNSFVSFQPIGTVFGIMPWNFPFWQVFRFAVPNVFAGNGAILKHSPNTTGCALIIEALFQEAGFPKDLFRTVIIDIPKTESIIAHSQVAGVTLTGSTNAGKSVAQLGGKYLKKTVLELGGSDPYLILDDADLDLAIEKCVEGRLINTGQSCIAAKRFFVTKKNFEQVLEGFKSRFDQKKSGDPMNPETDLGPIARKDLKDKLEDQVNAAVREGADLLRINDKKSGKGYFFSPVILTNINPGDAAFREELFGPVASLISCENEDEMITLANRSNYGLGSALFSRDIEKATYLAKNKLEAGCCFINDFVRSDSRLPFGGIKESGYGRELSEFGIREFLNIKTIYQN